MAGQEVGVNNGEQSLAGELVEQRLHQNYYAIANSLAVPELRVLLVQEELLTAPEAEPISDGVSLLEKVGEKVQEIGPEAYTALHACISQLEHHLGHRYVRALLEGRVYATEQEAKRCDMIKQNMLGNLAKFANCDISALTPLMVSCELVTCAEAATQLLKVDQPSLPLRLVNLLNTKGPLAYGLFAECLHRETSHITHRELYDLVIQPVSSTRKRHWRLAAGLPNRRRPLPSHKLHGCLQGRQYNDVMRTFQSCHHNGKWAELEAEAAKLSSRDTPLELQVVGLLETAVSWVFRRKAANVVDLADKAKLLLMQVKGDNGILLRGRCEYILSRLYRYLKDYGKAQEHVEKAAYHLMYAKAGEDSAFVHYCDACIKVERLSESPSVQEIEAAEMRYKYAIDHARRHDSGLDLVAPHSFMRLAQMYLGSGHYMAGSKHDPESIQKASSCLSQVGVSSLAQRSKCHFWSIQSDLRRSQGKRSQAVESAQLALAVAKENNFTLEIHSAEVRLDSLLHVGST